MELLPATGFAFMILAVGLIMQRLDYITPEERRAIVANRFFKAAVLLIILAVVFACVGIPFYVLWRSETWLTVSATVLGILGITSAIYGYIFKQPNRTAASRKLQVLGHLCLHIGLIMILAYVLTVLFDVFC